MQRRRYTMLGRWLLVWGMGTVALTMLLTGFIKLGAPWSDATVDVTLQDDALLREAGALYPNLDFDSVELNVNAEWLRSSDTLQSTLERLQLGQRLTLTEAGDTWDIRIRERLRRWACAQGHSQWLTENSNLCSWLGSIIRTKTTFDQRDIVNDRLSLVLSDDGRLLTIGFRSAHRDLSIAMVASLGEMLVAERETAKQALRRRISNGIETERATSDRQAVTVAENVDEDDDAVVESQTEIRLFRKVAGAMELANDDLGRLEAIKRNQAALTTLVTQGIVPSPSINEELARQVADVERDRNMLGDELAKMTAAFKNREWEGYRDLLSVAQPEKQEPQPRTESSTTLAKDEYAFLVHPGWAEPAAVLQGPVRVTGLSALTTIAIAVPLAILISITVALLLMVLNKRQERHTDAVEASFYANPHWPGVRIPQQSELNSAA